MTGEDPWSGWTADWRAAPQETPDFDALERRIRRHRRRRQAGSIIDIAVCLFGIGMSVWAMSSQQPAGIITGLAALAFSLFGMAVAVGGRHGPGALETRTVAGALAWEITAARAGIRTAIGGTMISVGALLFVLICLVVYQLTGALIRPVLFVSILAGGAAFALVAGGVSLVQFRRRKDRLRRLERLLADLKNDED